ncbi:DUF4268 domain-containing protein [Lentzea terrae]|uniref:DUF4268 domain-containing protein n=1 Tax=Lentzea terrae TaxID=2200761 RepID=UPI0013007371|nr:DUF4268 domain-containing protein [Lentzea terrae]
MSEVDDLGLGRLRRVANIRDIWSHEAVAFTPWLAKHIDVLGDELGMQLTVVATEVPIGEFRLDIHAEDEQGRPVVIENQLEPSDHSHLGQLVVYASGLGASSVIWVATRLRDDHRSALEWLNNSTPPGVGFFGIEIEAVRIGESSPAPVFNVVVQPNDWSKAVKQAGSVPATALAEVRMVFFERVFVLLATKYSTIKTPRVQPANWVSFASGPFGYYSLSFSRSGYRIEVYLDMGDKELTKALFDHFHGNRAELEQDLGLKLSWERLNERRASRLAIYRENFDLHNPDEVEQVALWTVDQVAKLHGKLDTQLRTLAKEIRSQQIGATAVDESPLSAT